MVEDRRKLVVAGAAGGSPAILPDAGPSDSSAGRGQGAGRGAAGWRKAVSGAWESERLENKSVCESAPAT